MVEEEQRFVLKLAEEQRSLLIGAVDQCFLRLIDQLNFAIPTDSPLPLDFMKPTTQPMLIEQPEECLPALPQPMIPAPPSPRHDSSKEIDEDPISAEIDEDPISAEPSQVSVLKLKWKSLEGIYPTKSNQAFLDVVIGVVILFNAFAMLADFEYDGLVHAKDLGIQASVWPESLGVALQTSETIFAVVFLLELLLRLSVLRLDYFRSCFNILDALLVLVSLISVANLQATAVMNLNVVRLVRLARIMRSLRLFRAMRLFSGLRIMVSSINKTLPFLMWALCFLAVYILVAALIVGHLLKTFTEDEDQDLDIRRWVWEHYGTSFWAAYTMFEITFSGGWPGKVRPVLMHVSSWYIILFLPFVAFVNFAALKVITGIILKETFNATYADASIIAAEKLKSHKKQMAELARIFKTLDTTGDGKISEEEFLEALDKPEVRYFLEDLGMLPHEMRGLFHLVDDGDGHISWEEFMNSVSRLKGAPREADIIVIERELAQIKSCVMRLEERSSAAASAAI